MITTSVWVTCGACNGSRVLQFSSPDSSHADSAGMVSQECGSCGGMGLVLETRSIG